MRDPNLVRWNEQFKILQDTWPKPDNFNGCIDIFLNLHAMVHSAEATNTTLFSFEDEVWSRISEEAFRKVHKADQSIAWKLWHSGRIEDMTMNILIAGDAQVFNEGGWPEKLKSRVLDTGNTMDEENIEKLSNILDMQALREYRIAVARKTREIVKALAPEDLKRRMDPARLGRLTDEGAVAKDAGFIIEYWGGKTYAGLLLMPASRHLLVHLNESLKLLDKKKA